MLSAIISKMKIKTQRDFGSSGTLATLDCVCENDLMAAYARSEEDRCFTKYSPYGEAQVGASLLSGACNLMGGEQLYVVVTRREDGYECQGAIKLWKAERHFINARCVCVTDFGDGQAKVVEMAQSYVDEKVGFNMKTAIDNPPAVEFFVPGKDDYRVAFYDAKAFDRDTALADALKKAVDTPASAA